MELETVFHWVGIVFMTLCLLIMIGIAIAIFKIKKKIDEVHHRIEERINMITNIAHLGTDLVDAAKKAVGK
jgi:hypothetical protein